MTFYRLAHPQARVAPARDELLAIMVRETARTPYLPFQTNADAAAIARSGLLSFSELNAKYRIKAASFLMAPDHGKVAADIRLGVELAESSVVVTNGLV